MSDARFERPLSPERSSEEIERLRKIFDSEDILRCVNEAVTEALRRHKERGESIVVWRDGKIVTLKPEEIDV